MWIIAQRNSVSSLHLPAVVVKIGKWVVPLQVTNASNRTYSAHGQGEAMARHCKRSGTWRTVEVCVLLLLAAATTGAWGSASVLLEQPYGTLNVVYPAGHAAIYLDHVCAETPLVLRPCRADELGVVISRYNDVGGYDWVAMPLIPYLYSVRTVAEIPDFLNREDETRLRESYRKQYLTAVAPDLPDGSAPDSNWYELVGSAFDRTIYGFRVNTTPEQDARLIASFNDRRNVERYNGMFRNCADFVRETINRLYPHAVRRNYVADLGMTSPKSVARSLSHHAAKHPEMGFEVFVIPQVKGSLPRSHANVDLAEGILKRYGLPLIVVSPVATGVVLAAYVGQGRFAMPQDAPLLDLAELRAEAVLSAERTSGATPWIERPFPDSAPLFAPPTARLTVLQVPVKAGGMAVSVAMRQ